VGEPSAETPTLVKLICAESAMSTFHFAASTEVMIQIKTNLSRAYTYSVRYPPDGGLDGAEVGGFFKRKASNGDVLLRRNAEKPGLANPAASSPSQGRVVLGWIRGRVPYATTLRHFLPPQLERRCGRGDALGLGLDSSDTPLKRCSIRRLSLPKK
jgi:hypothetical protein